MLADDKLATRVGAVALLLLAAAIGFFVFVYGKVEWGAHVRVRVYFEQITALHEGAPIVIGGRTVGAVESIALSPAGAPTPLGGTEGVAVTVALEARWASQIARGGDVFLASKGAFSDRYLEIGPAPSAGPPLADGDQIRGSDPPNLDRVWSRAWDNMETTSRFFDAIRPELDRLRGEIATLSATLHDLPSIAPVRDDTLALLAEAVRTRDVALGGDAGLVRLQTTIALARTTLVELRATLAELDTRAQLLRAGLVAVQDRAGARAVVALEHVQLAIERAQAAFAKIDPLLASATELADRLARGEGSIGKLMHDPEFPEDAKDLGRALKRAPWKIIGHPSD